MTGHEVSPGQDTATGTDPDAKYSSPGYEDKSLGQAVNQDMEMVDELVADTHGDLGAAEERFARESAGAPALARQSGDDSDDRATTPQASGTLTGEAEAEKNRANDPPA